MNPSRTKNIAIKTVLAAALLLVFMQAYWHATMPGYFEGLDICAKGCHVTRVLTPKKITGPFWCVGCHGFGVKSEILPGIPLHRDHQLELMVEEHGECLMCHNIPDDFHRAHMNTSEAALMKAKLERPVKCIDCHVKAYSGGHTWRPGNKPCIKCHNPETLHGNITNKELISNCLACHGPKAVVDYKLFVPGRASYSEVIDSVHKLIDTIGRWNVTPDSCRACHNTPVNPGHLAHYNKTYTVHGVKKRVNCLDCHAKTLLHGAAPKLDACTRCHKPSETRMHDKFAAYHNPACNRCHAGFLKASLKLTPGKGCTACHGESLFAVADTGLHGAHIRFYHSCSVCHKTEKIKTHKEFIDSVKHDTNKLCLRCHTRSGGLTSNATLNMATRPASGLLSYGAGPLHVEMVERAHGDCISCHSEWSVTEKPAVTYVYTTPPWPKPLLREKSGGG